MIGVGFLDKNLREYLSYQFHFVEPKKIFLSMATYRSFLGTSDQVSDGATYIFNPNGEVIIKKEHFNPHGIEETKTSFDPLYNYEDVPEFGNYSRIIRVER